MRQIWFPRGLLAACSLPAKLRALVQQSRYSQYFIERSNNEKFATIDSGALHSVALDAEIHSVCLEVFSRSTNEVSVQGILVVSFNVVILVLVLNLLDN